MSEEPISIRCSALPRIMRCPASAAPSNVVSYSPEAALGTLVHEAMSKPGDIGNIVTQAENAGLDGAEARFLIYAALEADATLIVEAGVTDVQRETPIEADLATVKLTGTPDVRGMIEPRRRLIVDYKAGRVDRDYAHQLRGYALLDMLNDETIDEVVCQIAWLRAKVVDTFTVTRVQAAEWLAELIRRLVSGAYTDDIEVCGFCPHRPDCGQYARMLNVATVALARPGENLPTSPVHLAKLYPAAQELARTLEAYKAALRAAVAQEGPIPIGEGREVALEVLNRASIDAVKAAPIIHARLDADVLTIMDVNKSALEDALREQAPRGMKKKAVDDCMFALEAAGALTRKASDALVMRKAKESGNG